MTDMTLRQAISTAARRLAGEPQLQATASRDAELLLLHALDLPRTTLYAYPGRLLCARETAAYAAAIDRRLLLEPVQYITGRQEFYGLDLEVGPGVLIPRPETELLVGAALERLPRDRAADVMDVGTGSGAIAIAVAMHLPLARVLAVDLSETALALAQRNVDRFGLGDRVRLQHSDLLAGVGGDVRFDAVLSNPPYVPSLDRAGLHPEVRDYEPAEALFAGEDGMDVYRRLLPQAHAVLRERGLLVMEMGYGQRDAMAQLLQDWRGVQFLEDLRGIARVAIGWRL